VPQANKKLFEAKRKPANFYKSLKASFFCLAERSFIQAHFFYSLEFLVLLFQDKRTKENNRSANQSLLRKYPFHKNTKPFFSQPIYAISQKQTPQKNN
jgi:hypothetical protein